ncbi:hypothetical protein ACYPKM_02595 [Pseudomonas aeruginosa]
MDHHDVELCDKCQCELEESQIGLCEGCLEGEAETNLEENF